MQSQGSTGQGGRPRRRSRAIAACLLVAPILAVTACGSDGDGAASTSAAANPPGASSSYLATAKALSTDAQNGLVYGPRNELSEPGTLRKMTSWLGPKSSPPVPKGKTIAFVSCGAEVCNETAEAGVRAAEQIGLDATVVNKNGTGDVQNVNQAMSSALAQSPDVIVGVCITATQVSDKLEEARSKGIVTVSTCDPTPTGGKGQFDAAADFANGLSTELLGWAIVASTEGTANVVAIQDKGYPAVVRKIGNLVKVVEGCAGCKVKTATWQVTDALNSATAANFLAGIINANPEMDTLVMPYSIGMQSAVRAVASSSRKIAIYADDADAVNLQELAQGNIAMLSSVDPQLVVHQAIDQAIRGLAGKPFVAPDELPYLAHLYTPKTAPKTGVGAFTRFFDYRAQYQRMWRER